MTFGIIYKATNKVNGKVYIGQTVQSLRVRRNSHYCLADNDAIKTHFHRALHKYDKHRFVWKIIEFCDTKEELDEMEFHYIKKFDSFKYGYNMTLGGEGTIGRVCSDVTREKISIANSGKKRSQRVKKLLSEKFSGKNNPMYGKVGSLAPNYGKKFSGETRLKMSKNQMGSLNNFYGKFHSYEVKLNKTKLYVITVPDGQELLIRGIYSFSKNHNLQGSSMIKVARGKQLKHKGYRCRYYTDDDKKIGDIITWL